MCFLIKISYDDEKKIIYLIDFLFQTESLLLSELKLLKIPGFLRFLFKTPGFSKFKKKSQVPDFFKVSR